MEAIEPRQNPMMKLRGESQWPRAVTGQRARALIKENIEMNPQSFINKYGRQTL